MRVFERAIRLNAGWTPEAGATPWRRRRDEGLGRRPSPSARGGVRRCLRVVSVGFETGAERPPQPPVPPVPVERWSSSLRSTRLETPGPEPGLQQAGSLEPGAERGDLVVV